jgi:hypothetical protein
MCGIEQTPASRRPRLDGARERKADGGDLMHKTNDALWFAFEVLAKTYPHDDGVRMTADLARWVVEERQRQRLPASPIMQKVVRTVAQELHPSAAEPFRRDPLTTE